MGVVDPGAGAKECPLDRSYVFCLIPAHSVEVSNCGRDAASLFKATEPVAGDPELTSNFTDPHERIVWLQGAGYGDPVRIWLPEPVAAGVVS